MLTEAQLDPIFEAASRDVFRLETQSEYEVPVEGPRLRAYLAGEPYDPATEPQRWYGEIAAWTRRGVRLRKVHVVRGPLTPYLCFECEWSYPATERHGQRTHILDLAETENPPTLPDYDFWMFDETVVLRFHYDEDGGFLGAEQLDENEAPRHVTYRGIALAAATPFPQYWAEHPRYWRENWLR